MPTQVLPAGLGLVSLATLAGCDVNYGFIMTIQVPPELTTGLTAEAPAQLVVGRTWGGAPIPEEGIGGLCEPQDAVREFQWEYTDYGCAEPLTAFAWLVPVPTERMAEFDCEGGWGQNPLADPSPTDPTGQAAVFDSDRKLPCSIYDTTLEVTLAAP